MTATQDDCYWSGREKGERYAEYVAVRDALVAAWMEPVYGGTKGHGFWIRGFSKSNGGETGNPAFFSPAECLATLRSLETLVPPPGFILLCDRFGGSQ
jgi:hypothetical protein